MTPEELIELYPQFEKIGFSTFTRLISKNTTLQFDSSKTWGEMGFDELDSVELIMFLEKEFDFNFSDFHFEEVFGLDKKPIDFISYNRNKIIDKIINDK